MSSQPTIGMTLDCNDLGLVAEFWAAALGYEQPNPPDPGAQFHGMMAPAGRGGLHHLTLQRVAEPKTTKNRAHLDLFVDDLDAEVERLGRLGGSVVAVHPGDDGGFRTTVMGDPEGNEFCVVERRR